MVAVWCGINDVGEPFWDGISAPVDEILDRYFGLLDTLYQDGLRNFVLFTVPRMFTSSPFLHPQPLSLSFIPLPQLDYQIGIFTTPSMILIKRTAFDKAPAIIYEDATRVASLQSDIKTYNAALQTRLATFKSEHSDVTGTLFDTAPTFETVLADPAAYGATDATCIGGTSCLWADSYHPSLVIHDLLAQALVQAVYFF